MMMLSGRTRLLLKNQTRIFYFTKKKRKIEVKCFELQILMEEQGYTDEEIDMKVAALRKELLSKMDDDVAPKRLIDAIHPKSVINPELPRLVPKGTHEIAAVSILKNSVFKDALGISEDYEDGSSMKMAALRRKQAEESRALFEAQKRLQSIKSSDESDSDSERESKPKKKARKVHNSEKTHKKKHRKSSSKHSHHSKSRRD
uniref:Serine/arginine repetitive matrix protein 2 n=1 Tax=Schistocephalus solidus TaxID=70667 RepID=A0A0X3PJL7_SCHSO